MQQAPPQQGMVMNSLPSPANVTTEQIQKYLDENKKLIMAILEHQSVGKVAECSSLQNKLQENLMYLAKIADAQPPPPQQPQGTLQPPQPQSVQQEQQQNFMMQQGSQGQGEWQQQQQQPVYLAPKHPFQMNDPKQHRPHQG